MSEQAPINPDDEEKIIYHRRPRWKTRDERELEQALADWFQTEAVLDEKKGMHSLDTLISEVVARLPLDVPAHDPDILRKGWKAAAGDFISSNADLVSIVKGVATIQVLQPAMRYHLKQWEPALLEKLRAQFGQETVKSIKLIFG